MWKPFVHFFKTPKGNYLYDVNTNAIVRVASQLYEYLSSGIEIPSSDVDILKKIETLRNAGMLSANRWEKIEHPATQVLKEYLDGSVGMLTLQVTQQCNLRCKYCPYSGNYYNRKHVNANMNIETAKKAVDFYIRHAYDKHELNIGFYGGEPLIQFDLIKDVVDYAYRQGEGKKVNFHITTNATLLDLEKISFLVKNKFATTISLDGPRELHDKNRRNVDGEGSFDRVIETIEVIQKNFPEYVRDIMFNCVIDGQCDYGCLNDFFTNYNTIKDIHTIFSNIAEQGVKDKKLLLSNEDYDNVYQYEVFKLLLNKCNMISEKEVSTIVKAYYEEVRLKLKRRNLGYVDNNIGHPSGPCIPGVNKLFINIYGDFYPCEKVSETIKEVVIGNVESGFDFERIEEILNVGKSTQEECINCWCSRFCYLCILFSEERNSLSAAKRISHCNSVRRMVENMLRDYCLIREIEANDNNIYFL